MAALTGSILILAGIGAYSWRAALIAAGLMLIIAVGARRREGSR